MVEDKGTLLFMANLAMAILALATVAARIYTRAFVAGGLGGDDYAMVGAAIVLTSTTAMMCYGVIYAGIGHHFLDLEIIEIMHLLRITYSLPVLHTLGVYPIKMSLLLFYRRLFGRDSLLQRIVKGFIIFETIHTVASSIGLIFICTPIASWWDIARRAQDCPTFHQTMIIYVSVRAVSVLTDVLVVCLPMKMVSDLKVPVMQKIGLASIFGLGVLTCIIAILRLAFLPELLLSLDVPWNLVPVTLLGRAEQCLGMITASIPALTAHISKKGSAGSYELSALGMNNPAAKDFDFLAYAYDPDRINVMYTTAYAGSPPPGHPGPSFGSSIEHLVEGGGRWTEPNTISKTTTVEVTVSPR
ncbi:hypothetical protein L873DRAFT_1678860 [Choiromyces venosus 120613-1]|uniref:Rhodopsin domain-containing protein n=1 Tax=Choiromyces venosus 120613-1 TaxID=1336337 RepID=A0A3N4JR05_9PEZI|nr:hypothetical protein L873DRAFT_1678860 [Choiromyces venosus 120613-1]